MYRCAAQLALVLLFAIGACTSAAPARELSSVVPSSFRNDTLHTVTVTGKGLNDIPVVSLGSEKRVELRQSYRVSLLARTEIRFQPAEVRRDPPDRLEFDVPAGTPPGTYDVRVQPPLGAALVFPKGLTILGADAADAVVDAGTTQLGDAAQASDASQQLADSYLSLEDAAGGEGAKLDPERAYTAGTLLDCYAILRDKDGAYKQDVSVSWTVTGATNSQPTEGASARIALATPGDVTIDAAHEAFGHVSVTLHVSAGRAVRLQLSPESASLQAGDPALKLGVTGEDAAGNPTQNYGELTFSLADGSLRGFDAASATLTPELIGSGHVLVESSLGIAAMSGLFEVTPGPLAQLIVSPDTVQLSADDALFQFQASGTDAFDNATDVLGTLTWTVASGPITSLSSAGQVTPAKAGTGVLRVSSSLGLSAVSGDIVITPGHAASLSVTPSTWHGIVGGATQQFTTAGSDADGNVTTDLGTLSYAVTGPIQAINPSSGLLTPATAGQGTVKATSSYGPSASTQNVLLSSPSATVTPTALRLATLFHGATTRIEIDLTTNDVADALLTGLAFTFADNNSNDLTSDYTVVPDYANSDHVVPGQKLTQVYFVIVSGSASYQGAVYVTVKGDAFNSAGTAVALSSFGITTQIPATFGTGLSIDAPVPPADRICSGGRVTFSASVTDSRFGYTWSFPDGTLASGSSLTDKSPSVDFSTLGVKSYAVTASYTFFGITYATTLPSILKPVFVGTSLNTPADTYPTGRVVFSSPSANQNVALSSFPRSNLIALDPSLPVRQCNNQAVDATGHNYLTVFSDRKLIDPGADSDSSLPGIQLQLTAQGGLPSVPLIAAASSVEGPTTLYAEYSDAQRGVSAGGDTTFNLSADTQAPSVRFSSPASDCASACLKSRDPLVFQFSEPLAPASVSNVLVDLYSAASSCTGSFSDWTSSSILRYEPTESALYVSTPVRSGVYSVRVRLPATVTDTATAKNALPALSRCVVFGALTDASAPATPQLIATPASVISPDGDQLAEVVTWNVSVDGATSLLHLRILRAGKAIWGKLVPVTQAGTYSIAWDGTDPAGRVVNNGGYAYTLEALNRAGVASTALRGVVEVVSGVRLVSVRRRQ